MTTDITELAQRMKAAAVRTKAATEDYVAHRMSITVCLEECKEFDDLSDDPDNILALVEALEKAQTINAAAEKLVRCKGRYHSEQNYRALAALFGVNTPDLPPLDSEPRTVTVDADVSDRNQQGMVVAVHIDAGDFVKVKGQVYEVEETDFDDHDVTLWFVGGETLKCAAGCQIEVVSAPRETE